MPAENLGCDGERFGDGVRNQVPILAGRFSSGDTIRVDVGEGKLTFEKADGSVAADEART